METKTQDSEKAQLLQTVEMFEAVTQANPDDYQSLEILKEAYLKLGRDEDSLRVSKLIARAHQSIGQISQAILQYEGLLQKFPDDAEAASALEELQQSALVSDPASGSRTGHAEGDADQAHHDRPSGRDGDELLCDMIVKRSSRLRQNST